MVTVPDGAVVDLGCGDGRLTALAPGRWPQRQPRHRLVGGDAGAAPRERGWPSSWATSAAGRRRRRTTSCCPTPPCTGCRITGGVRPLAGRPATRRAIGRAGAGQFRPSVAYGGRGSDGRAGAFCRPDPVASTCCGRSSTPPSSTTSGRCSSTSGCRCSCTTSTRAPTWSSGSRERR